MYKTLGCFHSLQPRDSPFDTPSLPALTSGGYVRWQTLQLLLCPEDHVPFMQRAVEIYDVPTADGGVFPKSIPRECFPDKPDEEMERWHRMVTGTLEQAHIKRLKNSPFQSPRDVPERLHEGYFVQNGKAHVHRPRQSRTNSQDQETAHPAAGRRRSSIPDTAPPFSGGLDSSFGWSGQAPPVPPSTFPKFDPKHSPQTMHRTTQSSQHHGLADKSSHHRSSNSPHRTSNGSTSYRPPASTLVNPTSHGYNRRESHPQSSKHHNHKKPSIIGESSSGSQASSEESYVGTRPSPNSKHARDDRRRSSLFPPSVGGLLHHLRRHSHDASYLKSKPDLPPRLGGYPHQVQGERPPLLPKSNLPHKHANATERPKSLHNSVKFRTPNFDTHKDDAANSAPESPALKNFRPFRGETPKLRYIDPAGQDRTPYIGDLSRQRSTGNYRTNPRQDRSSQRKSGVPIRVSTVTGVGGRKYASAEPKSAGASASPRSPFPATLGSVSSPQIQPRMSMAGVGR